MATTLSSCFTPLTSPSRLKIKTTTSNKLHTHNMLNIPSTTTTIHATLNPPVTTTTPTNLPITKIPGDYGFPILGPIKDRQDYFYNQGRDEFFMSRMQKFGSTVFRVNLPPGPPISSSPNVIALLDGKSFPILFDTSKVEKKDVFTGTYMPSVDLTGGYRILSYLDPSESNHAPLKELTMKLLTSTCHRIVPQFHSSFSKLFDNLENELETNGPAKFNEPAEQAAFNFLCRAWLGADPTESELGDNGPTLIGKWVLFQLAPVLTLGLPKALEETTFRNVRLPFWLIKKDYQKLYDFFYQNSGTILDEAAQLGISRDEACHNMIFTTCFNTFGGMKIMFPNMVKQIGRVGIELHTQLAKEIRSSVQSNGGKVTMSAMEQMPLMKSVVYECLRIEPPVPMQYGRAKKELIIESHHAAFRVKEGEMLCGYQPMATRDPKIFDRGDKFKPDRFMGEGERFLKYLLWSNGPESDDPTVHNKQCAGKDFVILVARLLVVELFLRYDSFKVEIGYSPLGAKVSFTELQHATF